MDALAQRSAAAQRMLNSMTPEQREELMELSMQAFGSARADGPDWPAWTRTCGRCVPARTGTARAVPRRPGLGLGDGTGALQDLAELDALGEQLSQSYAGARLDDVDLDALQRQLGDHAAVDAKTLAGAGAGAA
jgi:uncharacterized protein with von Willebrand factor type A (vWA) domain